MRQLYLNHRWLRLSLRIFAGIIAVLLILWAILSWYVHAHKKELMAKLTEKLSEQVQGTFAVRDIEPSFWSSFPNISIVLKDVSLRDSLWSQHHHSLLEVKDLYVKVNAIALFSHRVEVMKVTAAHGSIFVYADKNNYSNAYLLDRRDTTKRNHTTLVDHFALNDIDFFFIHEVKHKDFNIHIATLEGNSSEALGIMRIRLAVKAHVNSLAFSTIRGSYIKGQDLGIDGTLSYNKETKVLDMPEQALRIGNEQASMAAQFKFSTVPATFALRLKANVPFATARSWVAPNISRIMMSYDFAKPFPLVADVSGEMRYKSIPLVTVKWTITDNTLKTPLGDVIKMNALGRYYNEIIPGAGHGDDNSEIRFTGLHGEWRKLPFEGDTLSVRNLLVPYVNAHIKSEFDVAALNDIIGSADFNFSKGKAGADLHYSGGVLPTDTTPNSLNGYVQLQNTAVAYVPRSIAFVDVGAKVVFAGDNLYLRDVALRTEQSAIKMEGEALHFLRFYFSDPGKILISWRAVSSQLNLNEFRSFMVRRKKVAAPGGNVAKGGLQRVSAQLNNVLDQSSIAIDAKVDRLIYRQFKASAVVAKATMAQSGVIIEKVSLQQAGGTIDLSGGIHLAERENPFELKASLQNVDVAGTFKAFENFGQDGIGADNLKGRLTAQVTVSGGMNEDGNIIRNSLNGKVNFILRDGELNNFSPFEKISKYVFKKRHLEHVTFEDIHNSLDIQGSKIAIPPMDIQTSALNMQVGGVYSLGSTGTDLAIQIPLRNPEKKKAKTPIGMLLRGGKGIVVHLRAQDGGANGVKIGWDPLHKGKREVPDSLRLD